MAKKEIDRSKLRITISRLRALAHPVSLEIVSLLESESKLNVGAIQKRIKLEQAATSYHLTRLKRKGILISKRVGKETFYSVKQDSLKTMIEAINNCGE